jgi:hypothetical protein
MWSAAPLPIRARETSFDYAHRGRTPGMHVLKWRNEPERQVSLPSLTCRISRDVRRAAAAPYATLPYRAI